MTNPGYFGAYQNLAMSHDDNGALTVRFHTGGCLPELTQTFVPSRSRQNSRGPDCPHRQDGLFRTGTRLCGVPRGGFGGSAVKIMS